MKKILLPDVTFGMQVEGTVTQITAGEQLHLIVASPGKPGDYFTIDQIRTRLPLVEKLATLGDEREFLVEDSEYAELLAAVRGCTWQAVSRIALALVDAIEGAEVVGVKEQTDV